MMTSCLRGLGHFLGECVPYPNQPTEGRRPRSTSGHVAPTPSPPTRTSRPSTGTTVVTSRGSGRVVGEGARYLVVRPASPRRARTPSPRRSASSQYRRRTTSGAPTPRSFGLYSQRRSSSGGGPPLMVLTRGFQLPPIPSSESRSFLYSYGFKCPVCSKLVLADDLECHLVICLTKPRISYNEDVLCEDKGECVICLEDLSQGDTIARLPCLCIYHKACIDEWFQVNRSCPEHPYD